MGSEFLRLKARKASAAERFSLERDEIVFGLTKGAGFVHFLDNDSVILKGDGKLIPIADLECFSNIHGDHNATEIIDFSDTAILFHNFTPHFVLVILPNNGIFVNRKLHFLSKKLLFSLLLFAMRCVII